MSDLSRTAAILHERHGDLLCAAPGEPYLVAVTDIRQARITASIAAAVDALEAARQRLRGDDGPGRDQLMLDVAGRG